ncbi:hypothetical protein [Xylanimonas sp. McL0601]|uniref:hypothetical protein n=1 Tax=Xylanimonas sp. McL0601 TaxID=3414739 RepID=UPI003CF7C165
MAEGHGDVRRARARRRGLLVAAVLAAAWSAGIGPAAAGDPGIAIESHARYVVDPGGGPVQVSVTTTLRNIKPDTASWRFYFDGFTLPVPAGATSVTATSGGRALRVQIDDTDDPTTQIAGTSFAPLYHGRSRTIEWSYLIPGAPVRSANTNRVGPGYATFFVQAVGDQGHVSAEVVAPASMKVDTSDGGFERRPDGDVVRYVRETSTDDDGIWAVVSARDALVSDAKEVTVGSATITLESFPGDSAWTDFVSEHVTKGLPVLERVVGTPWPGGLESIREDVAPQALQYAWFDSSVDDIVVAEDLDAATLFHEMGHAWFDGRRFTDRWLYEGLTEVVAQRVVSETDGNASPRPAPDRGAAVALPLTAWSVDHQGSFDVEDYAYAASSTAVTGLLGKLDDDAFAAVVSAAYAGESGYEPAGSRAEDLRPTDWRRFLDLVEQRGGVRGADQVYRTWVVSADEAKELDARAAARSEYAHVDGADGAWLPPLGLRRAMTEWDFDRAGTVVDALAAAPQAAASVQAAATAAALTVPEVVREAYESAATDARYAEVGPQLERAAEVLPAVGAARDAAARDHDPFSRLGQLALGVDGAAGDALAAIADGDTEGAATAADAATSRAEAAPWVGVGLVAVLLGALAGTVTLGVRRRQRRGRLASVLQDPLEQDVVLPAAGDAEVPLGEPEALESVAGQHGL